MKAMHVMHCQFSIFNSMSIKDLITINSEGLIDVDTVLTEWQNIEGVWIYNANFLFLNWTLWCDKSYKLFRQYEWFHTIWLTKE